jgi:hypothetical protein
MPSTRSAESQTRGIVRPAGPEDDLELIWGRRFKVRKRKPIAPRCCNLDEPLHGSIAAARERARVTALRSFTASHPEPPTATAGQQGDEAQGRHDVEEGQQQVLPPIPTTTTSKKREQGLLRGSPPQIEAARARIEAKPGEIVTTTSLQGRHSIPNLEARSSRLIGGDATRSRPHHRPPRTQRRRGDRTPAIAA